MDSRLPMTFGNIEDPINLEERCRMAQFCSQELGLTLPAVVDRLNDSVSMAYQAWPERLYLIDTEGIVQFRGGPGPFGFDPDGLEQAILDNPHLSR